MDPISATSSILTLLGAAGGSCKFLFDFLLNLAEAPRDIRTQNERLGCIHETITTLIQTYSQLPSEFQFQPYLKSGLVAFTNKLGKIRAKIETRSTLLQKGRIRSLDESFKWLFYDRKLRKFLASLDEWDMILSQAVMASQLTLCMRIEQHTSTLLSVTQRAPCNPQRVLGDLHDEMPCALSLSLTPLETIKHNDQICNESISHKTPLESIPERLQGYLATIEEPSGSQYQFWGQMFLSILRVSIHCGTPILRRWTKNGLEKHVNVPAQEGYAVVAILQCTKWVQARLSIRLIALYSRSSLFDLCLRCDIKGSTSFLFNGLHHRAIASGDFNHLQEAFSKKTLSPYDSTLDGDTLLHVSISLFRAEVFELKQIVACSRARSMRDHYFLDQEGAVVNATNDKGETPLHISTKRGSSYECVRLLLSNGADISRQSKDGATPLHTFYNDTVGFVVHYYREHLDLSIQDFRGMTILHWISWTRKTTLADITVKIYPLVTAAQSPGINAAYNVRDNNGKTMIHYATERGNVPLVEFLLSQMKTLATSITDYSGCSLLHYAVGSSRVELIDRLLQQGLNLDSVDQDGKTVMHHAAMRGNLTAVKQLMNMNAGYQLSAEDKQGRTPFQLAETCGSQSVVDYLRSERSMWKPDAPRLKSAETGRSPPYVFRSSSKWTRPSLLLGMVSLIVIIFVGLSAFIHLWIRN